MLPTEFQRFYNMLPEPMLLISSGGEVLAANRAAAELLGRAQSSVTGLRLCELTTEPESKLSRILAQWQRSGELLPGALVIRCTDGSTVECRAEGAVFVPSRNDTAGQIMLRLVPKATATNRFLALNDKIEALNKEIVDRRRAESALGRTNDDLRRANADLEQFAYSASHDLREPLRMVALYSDLLKRRYAARLDQRADEYLDLAAQGARRMEALVADLLAYTQVVVADGGCDDLVLADVVLDEALSNLKELITESGAVVQRDPLPMLFVQQFHLLQLFQNLLGNAMKYRGDHPPKIHVKAHPEGDMWRLSIHDNGIGIDPQYAEQIFGVFKRLHTADTYPGTGIGLAICQKIVHRYGGRIWVESDGRRSGSTFRFTLPGTRHAACGSAPEAVHPSSGR